MLQDVFQAIDFSEDYFIHIWEDICNIESPSNYKEGVDRVGIYLGILAMEHDWRVEIFEQERFGNVFCITMNPKAPNPPVVLSGHMDTVHPLGSFGKPAVKRKQNKLYGPGAMDCKGGIVAGFMAMAALEYCGFQKRPIMMLLQSNEEIGSGLNNKEPIHYICQKAKDSVAFLNLEGHESYFEGKACLIRKGIAGFQFHITGVATHASYCAREGASAIAEAAYKITEIEKLKDDNGITCNCGIISGGSAVNTVPAQCSFDVDVRFSTQEEYKQVKTTLQQISDTVHIPGCTCQLIQTSLRPAMELTEQNIALLKKANQLFAASGLSPLKIGKRNGGSDAADVTAHGIACIDSLGVAGEYAHSAKEYGVISSLAESAKRIAAIVYGI